MSHFETIAIHAGQEPDETTGAVIPSLHLTTTYVMEKPDEETGYSYSRAANPTRDALQSVLAGLEGGNWALSYASGMAAIQNLMQYMVKAGDHVLITQGSYGGTYRFGTEVLPAYGVETSLVDMSDLDAVAAALRPETRLVWAETPTNPYLKITDIAGVAAVLNDHPAKLVVDNTFASPYLQNPLSHGADFVVHSATKYLGGHSDVIGGAIVGNDAADYERLSDLQRTAGAISSPFDCWLTMRGIKTLAVRMERHCANARAIAEFLVEHDAVEEVFWPGLPSHPGHDIAARQMRDFSGMVSFTARGGREYARRILERMKLFSVATSLGGVESLIEMPGAFERPTPEGETPRIGMSLIRMSIGIEHVDDLLGDLDQALG